MKMLGMILILMMVIALVYYLYKFIKNPPDDALLNFKHFNLNRLFKPVKLVQEKNDKNEKNDKPAVIEKVNHEDVKLFDDVAKLFFYKLIRKHELDSAEQIQAEFLNKMPTQTQTQIKQFDLGEWSVFWSYKNQSLEYYASRYGIFYTHVDAKGVEHKQEYTIAV